MCPESNLDDVLRRARAAEPEAMDQLILQCRPIVRRYLEKRSGEGVRRFLSVSDLEQEALARVPDLAGRLQDGASFQDLEALLIQNARWIIQNTARGRRRYDGESAAGDEQAAQSLLSEGDVTRADEREWLVRQLDELPEELAPVVRLRMEERSFAEIGEALGVSEATARRRFLEAAQRLGKP